MHVTNGYFDESQFGPSADWEFWLRAGRQKVQFHLIGEALGLHLKTPDSYWRRSKQSSSFDEKIIRQYTDDHGRYRVPVEERPFALEFAESIRARTAGFVLRYLWCLLVNYGAIRLGTHLADSQRKLVVARCEADFGITEGILEKVYARTGADAVESADKVSEVFWHLVDALHLQPKGVVRSSSTVIQNMQGVVDELLLSNSLCELYVFKAYLSRRMENPGAEAYYLHRARRAKGAEFWEALEKIYRAPTTIKKLRDARDF